MTDHTHTVLTDGCYRCDLNRDEMEGARDMLIEDIAKALPNASLDHLYVIEAVLEL